MRRGRVVQWEIDSVDRGLFVPYWEAASVVERREARRARVPIPKKYVKSAVFIVDGEGQRPEGTGFIIAAIRKAGGVPHYAIKYLVTCRHIVQDMQSPHVRIRVDAEKTEDRRLTDGPYYHPTGPAAADVAMFPIEFKAKGAGSFLRTSRVIPLRYLPPEEAKKRPKRIESAIGHDVFYAGFLRDVESMDDLVPMVRSGILGAKNQPGIPVKHRGKVFHVKGHLIDARAFHGFSGSPCFVQTRKRREDAPWEYEEFAQEWNAGRYLPKMETSFFGMLAGFWMAGGVGVVIPRRTIIETLEQEALLEDREEREEAQKQRREARKRGPKPAESASSEPGPEED